jgi:dimethylargininase
MPDDGPVITRGNALVRRPSPRLAEGIVTHIERSAVDVGLALDQHDDYVHALQSLGWEVVFVEPADECPDSVFIEDTLVVIGDIAVLTRPGAETRRPEIEGVAAAIEPFGLPIHRIEAPGTLDGGDVLQVGDRVYVGRGGRTNAEGIRQLRRIARDAGRTVVAVPLERVLHLKSAVTVLPDGTFLIFEDLVDANLFPAVRAVTEEPGAHVVLLGGDDVLVAASAPVTAAMIADLGYSPVVVDISEFEKLEGCVTCLNVLIPG